jgi:hypothetical protein
MSYTIVGTCSLCRGPVGVPSLWSGSIPPVSTCQQCGATKRNNYGPVIDMDPNARTFALEEAIKKLLASKAPW